MTAFSITPISPTDRRAVDRFIRVPWWIHREHAPNDRWIPPLLLDRRDLLDTRKHPFWRHAELGLWVARRGDREVGRIAAIDDEDLRRDVDPRTGAFGFFEAPDDPELAQALLDAARGWLASRGLTRMIGPLDPSSNYQMGVLVDGHGTAPAINMPYNPRYYDALLRGAGLTKAKDLLQWTFSVERGLPARLERVADLVTRKLDARVRSFDFSRWEREVDKTLELYVDAWQHNWGFVRPRREEYHHIAKDLKLVLHREMGIFVELAGQEVGFSLAIADLNPILAKLDGRLLPTGLVRLLWDLYVRRRVDRGRLILMGVAKAHHRKGLDALLIIETFRRCQRIGWRGGQLGWTLEDNEAINAPIRQAGAELVARYRVYEGPLDGGPRLPDPS